MIITGFNFRLWHVDDLCFTHGSLEAVQIFQGLNANFASGSGEFPIKLIWCQASQIGMGSGYGLIPSGNNP